MTISNLFMLTMTHLAQLHEAHLRSTRIALIKARVGVRK